MDPGPDESLMAAEAFKGLFNERHLIIVTTWAMVKAAIRSRLSLDKSPHILLLSSGLHSGPREEFPFFPQLYMTLWGPVISNPWLHGAIAEIFLQRVREQNHVWMFMPQSLETMARRWGPDLLKLSGFPQLTIDGPPDLFDRDLVGPENIHEQDGSDLPEWFWRPS
jgi:hypothetical protein